MHALSLQQGQQAQDGEKEEEQQLWQQAQDHDQEEGLQPWLNVLFGFFS